MRCTICTLTATTLLMLAFLGIANAQIAVQQTQFSVVTMPSHTGQQVLLGSLPLGSATQAGLASFDFQAVGLFKGFDWQPFYPTSTQETYDVFLCDTANCKGSVQSQLGRVILSPYAGGCLDGFVTLRGTFAQSGGGVRDATFTGVLEGLWTQRLKLNIPACGGSGINDIDREADGMIDRPSYTGPIAALPTVSNVPVNTTGNLFLVLMTTLLVDNENFGQYPHTGQMSLMRAVVYPPQN